MRKRNKIAIGIFLIFYVSFGALLALNQERVIYRPSSQDFAHCPNFPSADAITYRGTRMYVERTNKPTIVLYHGNAGSACDRAFYKNIFTQAGYDSIVVEYAGYSNDAQRPTHDRIKTDVENVITYLEEEKIDRVLVVGESIGTGFASYHASLAPPEKLLLISTFTNLADIARKRFWFYPTSLLISNALDNTVFLEKYSGEVTIIHGTKDTLIPFQLGEALYFSVPSEHKDLIPIHGAGHNDLFLFDAMHEAVVAALE